MPHYSRIEKLEDLQKVIDHLTAKTDDTWNQLPQKIKDDLLHDCYERIAEHSLQNALNEVKAQDKPRRTRRKKTPAVKSGGEDGSQSA